jgi:hypothetical protein
MHISMDAEGMWSRRLDWALRLVAPRSSALLRQPKVTDLAQGKESKHGLCEADANDGRH